MSKKPEFHGSDLEKIEEYYQIPKEEIVSFGANVNPLGLSCAVKEKLSANLDIISTYPDRNYTSLKEAIANYTGISPKHIVVGNGSSADQKKLYYLVQLIQSMQESFLFVAARCLTTILKKN